MGKAARWLRNLLGGKKEKEQGKEQRRPATPNPPAPNNGDRKRWSFCKSSRDSSSEAPEPSEAPGGNNAAIARAAEAAWLKSLYKDTEREQSTRRRRGRAAHQPGADLGGVLRRLRGPRRRRCQDPDCFPRILGEEGAASAQGACEAAGAGARLPRAKTGGGHSAKHAGACPGAGLHPRRPLVARRRTAAPPRQPPQSRRPAALLIARAVRHHGRHAERARQRGGVLQPPPVGQRGVVVVRRLRPEPQDRGDGHQPAQVPLLLAPDEPAGGVRGRHRRGLLRLLLILGVVAAPATVPPPPSPPRRAPADRRAVPGLRLVREGQAGDGAEHAPVRELRAGDADEERVRRRRIQQQPVESELPELHVEHAFVRGEGAFAERAEAAAGGGQRRRAEAGAAERADHPAGGEGEPERRRGHAEVVQPGGGVQLQEGRGEPLRPLVGGQGPGLVPAAQGMVTLMASRWCP